MKKDFLWGAATSNVQAEGGYLEDGKGLNLYDTLKVTPEPGIPPMFCDTSVAVDHYHHWKEDIDLMAEMGFKAYRFSVVWSRINPMGDDEPNEKGLAYYEQMVDYLLEKGIEPVVSLVHFDMPDHLAKKYNGFMSKEVINFFVKHVETVVKRFKGKVKYYLTYNEVNTCFLGPQLIAGAVKPEGMTDGQFNSQLLINAMVAHVRALEAIKRIDPDAKVGAMINACPFYPASCAPSDLLAAQFMNNFYNYLVPDTVTTGMIPHYFEAYMKNQDVQADFSDSERQILKDSAGKLDYIAFSYYQTGCIGMPEGNNDFEREDLLLQFKGNCRNPYLQANEWGWQIDPDGLRFLLNDLTSRYHKPLFIVENGIGIDESLDENRKVYDDERIAYYAGHIEALKKAVEEDQVDLMGYLAWSPFDFLSSHKEIRKRYGFVYVDRTFDDIKECERIPKKSFYWYKRVIETNGENLGKDIEY